MSKDWTEDFEHENGMYQNRCRACNELFIGYKRRMTCKECATKQVKVEPEVIVQKTERKKMQPHIKELIIKILFDYYEHGVHTHAIMPASDAQIILNEVVRIIDEKIIDWKEHAFKSGGVALQELKESFLSE